MSLAYKNLTELRSLLDKKSISATELTQYYLDNIRKAKLLNAYITVAEEKALHQAKLFDEGLLPKTQVAGIPIGIKDLFCTQGIKTTNASKMLENFVPEYESTVTQRLQDQGAIALGKLNMDEFAMGSSNEKSFFGECFNPYVTDKHDRRVPGGSSGGSASAVAADLCVIALGSDTGGSVRQPAAFTGTVGLKPTYGTCSRYGMIAFASSFDQAGIISRTSYDNAIILDVIAGFDEKDSTTVNQPKINYFEHINKPLKGLVVGVPYELDNEAIDADIRKNWQQTIALFKDMGAIIQSVSLPNNSKALPAYYILAGSEASSNLSRFDGLKYGYRAQGHNYKDIYQNTRGQGFGREVRRRILLGTYMVSSESFDKYYKKANLLRQMIANDFTNAFSNCNLILLPTTPTTAFKPKEVLSQIQMYLNDAFTVGVNLAGLPGISFPTGLDSKGLPIGMQLIGNYFSEATLFQAVHQFEQNHPFKHQPLQWWN